MDSISSFNGKARHYETGRPAYAGELFDQLYSRYGFSSGSVIADIGSGTGKFSESLLKRGSTVFAVEPGTDMRQAAEKRLGRYGPRFHSVPGTAEQTGLPAHSMDFVTTAQAFHWFDTAKFKEECSRILRPGGKAVLIWNTRDIESPFIRQWYEVYAAFCPNFKGFSAGFREDDGRIAAFFEGRYETLSFSNPLQVNEEQFLSRSLSSSYSLKVGDAHYAEYRQALSALFNQFAIDGKLEIGYKTVAYLKKE